MRQLLILVFSLGLGLLPAQNFTGKQKISDPGTRNVFANMGYSTALTDSFAFIAAPQSAYDSANANPIGNAGIVLVYKRNSFGGWKFHQKIQSSNRNNLGQFGWSMAVQDSLLVVGARGEWVGFPNNGAAHIFQLQNNRWVHQQRLVSNDTVANARMGCSVAIDGNTIVVGAERNPTDSTGLNSWGNSGAAYVFEHQNGIWNFKEKLSASVQSSGYFGSGVAVQGNEIIVAAPEEWLSTTGVPLGYYGALYRFKRNVQGNWNQNLHYSDTLFQGGGTLAKSIAWQDSNLIISNLEFSYDTIISGGAVFHLNLNKLSTDPVLQIITAPFPLDNDQFGHDLVVEWPNLFIGVPNEDHDANQQNPMASAGAVYWYQYSTVVDSFQFQQVILPQDRTVPISTFDSFGWSVSYNNGELLVGARNDDEDSLNLNYLAGAGSAYFLDSVCFAISSLSRDTLCYGESVNFNGQVLDSSGTYQAIFSAANGCDSTVTLNLHVNNVHRDSSSIVACLNFQLPNGQIIYQSGLYYDTLTSISGCDSVVISNLQIDTVDTRIRSLSMPIGL